MKNLNRREKRHFSLRKYLEGTTQKPRLAVFRSGQYIYAQIIDDEKNQTLISESDLKMARGGTKVERAFKVGKSLAQKALKKKIDQVVFDRGGFLYHGRIKKLAEGAREGGLKF